MSNKTINKPVDPGKIAAPYDTAEFLRTPEDVIAYLEAIFEDYGDDTHMVVKALGDVARARGMQKIARATGLKREGLYKSLSLEGNPSFETIYKVMQALGVRLRPEAIPERKRRIRQAR